MKTIKKSNMIAIGILVAISLILVLVGCKKKVPSTVNATSSEASGYEQESTEFDQSDEPFSYLQSEDSEDEEPAEDPNEYPEEEPNQEPNDEPDEDEPGDDEPEYPDEQPNEDPNDPQEEPNDSPEDDPNESWL